MKLLLSTDEVSADIRDSAHMSPLVWALVVGDLEIVEELLLSGKANPNLRDNSGKTALYDSAHRGNNTVVKLLLKYNSDLDVRDNGGYTPLSFAARRGKLKVVELLL